VKTKRRFFIQLSIDFTVSTTNKNFKNEGEEMSLEQKLIRIEITENERNTEAMQLNV
jgi:hypothetical protein